MNRVEELTLKLLDGVITDEEREELERLTASDQEAAELHIALVEQEALLQGEGEAPGKGAAPDTVEAVLDRIRRDLQGRTESRVIQEIEARISKGRKPVEPELTWLGSRRFWKAAAAVFILAFCVVGGNSIRVNTLQAEPQEAFVYGQWLLSPGEPAPYRVFVRNGRTAEPVAGAKVLLRLTGKEAGILWEGESVTDASGFALAEPLPPENLSDGNYTLEVVAASEHGRSEIGRQVTIRRDYRLLVTTDKPLYQPGQIMHIRILGLAMADLKPAGNREAVIEVFDSKSNKVFKKRVTTSAFGVASADFRIADQVNLGKYVVRSQVEDTASERSVTVERYTLPKFRIDAEVERGFYGPGDPVRGEVEARYTFGEAVAGGEVKVEASEFIGRFVPFAEARGTLDEEGRFAFELPLKRSFSGVDFEKGDAMVALDITVTDRAGHVQKRSVDLTVTSRPIRIEVIPESGTLVQNVENVLYLITAYPDGRPARTRLSIGATREETETSELGIAKVRITPVKAELALTVTAEDAAGTAVTVTRPLRVGERVDAFLLRTDRSVYVAGETARITVLSAAGDTRVALDVIKDRRTVLMKSIDVAGGRGALELDLPEDLFGTLELNAYRVLSDGNMVSDTRVIQVKRPGALEITAELDKETYRPAEEAVLDLAVNRADGDPVQAALGLSAVDEAVFALTEMRPGLERIYFMLQEEILKPRFEIHAAFPVAARQAVDPVEPPDRPSPVLEEATVVLFSAAEGRTGVKQDQSDTYAAKQQRLEREKEEYNEGLGAGLLLLPAAIFLFLGLLVITYGAFRFFKGRELIGVPAHEADRLRDKAKALAAWWGAGVALPPIALAVFAFVWYAIHSIPAKGLGVIFILLSGIVVGVLAMEAKRFRGVPASAAASLYRKTALLIPAAYACFAAALIILFLLIIFGDSNVLKEDTAGIACLVVWFIAVLTTGALSLAWRTLNARPPTAALMGAAARSSFLAAFPAILLMAFYTATVPNLQSARLAAGSDRIPQWESERIPTEGKGGRGPKKGKGGKGGPGEPARVRRHFPETLFWMPELITDEQGRARVKVPLADSITTWRMAVSAVSQAGELGATDQGLRVFQDFFVDIDFPATLTQHDEVTVPVAVYNYLDRPQRVRLEVEAAPWFALAGSGTSTVEVGAREVTAATFGLKALKPGRHALVVRAFGSQMSDAVERSVRVEPDGTAVTATFNGTLYGAVEHAFEIPPDAIDGASSLLVKLYPGAFSQVVEGLDSIFRMPHGCFEQTSSITYPNVLALAYLRATEQGNPEVEMKAQNFINLGYQRLLTFEVDGGGFEWFGKAPANVVLTAYGLMEFCDMAEVHEVDPRLIDRTRKWLLSRQEDDGSWAPPDRGITEGAINRYRGAKLRTTAYVAWGLFESGAAGRRAEKALDFIAEGATGTEDPYTLALCANALIAGGRGRAGAEILDWLEAMKKEEGKTFYWEPAGEGLTYSRGRTLAIETTAIAAYAYLKIGHNVALAHKALNWLIEQKDPEGTWRSTQATVHAMRALLEGTGPAADLEGSTRIDLTLNGEAVEAVTIIPDTADVFRVIDLTDRIGKGRNLLSLAVDGVGTPAYQVVATHYVPWSAPRNEEKALAIAVIYDTTRLEADDILKAAVTVTYQRPGTAHMTIVDLGVPPGFELINDSLDALKTKGVIERYAVTGRQVILYFREIRSGEPVQFNVNMRARYPVKVKTPPATVYSYYEPSLRDESPPVEIEVR